MAVKNGGHLALSAKGVSRVAQARPVGAPRLQTEGLNPPPCLLGSGRDLVAITMPVQHRDGGPLLTSPTV